MTLISPAEEIRKLWPLRDDPFVRGWILWNVQMARALKTRCTCIAAAKCPRCLGLLK